MSRATRELRLRLPRAMALLAVAAVMHLSCQLDNQGLGSDSEGLQTVRSALVTTIGMVADSYVRSGSYAGNNFGTATTVQIDGEDVGTLVHGYIRFTVGALPAVASAKLRVYCTNASTGPIEVRRVASNTWGETTITWNNKPVTGTLVRTIGATSANTWVEIDITPAVTPNTTVSLALLPGTNDGFDFSSRNASANRPQVVIEDGTGGGTGGTGGSGAGGSGGSAGSPGGISTDPGLKVAFVGDTSDSTNYSNVLNLVKNEGAAALVIAGDMTYDADPNGWWATTESVLGQTFPVFLARGNHDDTSWSGFLPEAANHLGGATRVNGPHNAAYKTLFRGLNLVTIRKGDTDTTISNLFGTDTHLWKVCYWHQNQNKMQVGAKSDEMGWAVYEMCRQKGAIIVTGHEHTYHRTKTMTDVTLQIIDPYCSSGSSVCVGPNRTFVSVVGTGGTGLRSQVRCTPTASTAPYASLNTSDPSCPIWASIYTTNQGATYGAQFIVYNVDGNPKKARSYFKNINGVVIDSFDIFRD